MATDGALVRKIADASIASSETITPTTSWSSTATIRPPDLWQCDQLCARKHLLDFQFVAMDRPTELDECQIELSQVSTDCAASESHFLGAAVIELDVLESESTNTEYETVLVSLRLRTARTGLDCVLAAMLQQMMPGEQSRLHIWTGEPASSEAEEREIQLTVRLVSICPSERRHWHQLSAGEMAAWAAEQKANGVELFRRKQWRWAHWAFARAAKAFVSLKPFEKTAAAAAAAAERADGQDSGDAISATATAVAAEWQLQYEAVCVNLAACLVRERRWEDALYVLKDATERPPSDASPLSERAIYRRAVAHFGLRQLDEAREQIERLAWQKNADQRQLREQIVRGQGEQRSEYSGMVRKMFQS